MQIFLKPIKTKYFLHDSRAKYKTLSRPSPIKLIYHLPIMFSVHLACKFLLYIGRSMATAGDTESEQQSADKPTGLTVQADSFASSVPQQQPAGLQWHSIRHWQTGQP